MKALMIFCGFSLACVAAYSQQLATTNVAVNSRIKQEPVWFRRNDVNRNGVLDPDERRSLQSNAENQRTAFIVSMDKNGDGKIDAHEQWLAKSNQLAASGTVISTNRLK